MRGGARPHRPNAGRSAGRRLSPAIPAGPDSIVEVEERPVGRIVVDRAGGVLPRRYRAAAGMRRRGLGTRLLRSLMEETRRSGMVMQLGVAAGNVGAWRLYNRLGFTPIGRDAINIRLEWRPTD